VSINSVSAPQNYAGIAALQSAQNQTNEMSKKIIELAIELKTNTNKEKILGKAVDILA